MKKIMGLIYKDIIQMKSSLIVNLVIELLFIIVSLISFFEFTNNPNQEIDINSVEYAFELIANVASYSIVVIIMPYSLVLNSIGIDEKSQFTRFILASGCSRKSIIDEKTLFGVFAAIPGIILIISMSSLLLVTNNQFITPAFVIGLALYSMLAILFLNSIAILYSTIFSSISNQAVGVIIFMVVAGLLYGGIYLGSNFLGNNIALYFFYGAAGALLALSGACYFASIKIYQNKDF